VGRRHNPWFSDAATLLDNTLVLAPGGYRFGDYWRVGLPLEVVIVAIAVPMIVLVWGDETRHRLPPAVRWLPEDRGRS